MENTFLQDLLLHYPLLAPILFIIVRASAIIFPPIPGIAIDLPGIAIFGSMFGFILAQIGIMIGAMTAFFIARYFRDSIVKRYMSLQKIYEWEAKLSDTQSFWGFTVLRLFGNPVFDYVSYAAGLTGMKPWKFFLSSIIGNTPTIFLVYYFGGVVFEKGIYYIIVFIALLITVGILLKNTPDKSIDDSDF